jgi:hypothetical protein
VESIFHWYLEQKKNDEVAVRSRLRSSHYPGEAAAAEGTGSSCSALMAWVMRLLKSLATTFSDLQDRAVSLRKSIKIYAT